MIDLACLAVVGICTWCVASEGTWGAGLSFICTLLAGLLAMNFFEPLAVLLAGLLPDYANKADSVSLVGLFIGFVFAFRLLTERMVPTYIAVPALLETAGRWVFGAATGVVTMAFLLTALHTTALPREFLDFRAERRMVFGLAPDRHWLGFTQRVSECSLARYLFRLDSSGEVVANVFDGPYLVVGEKSNPYPNKVWASFPIRYAQRRELGGSGAAAPVITAPQNSSPVSVPTPAGGGF